MPAKKKQDKKADNKFPPASTCIPPEITLTPRTPIPEPSPLESELHQFKNSPYTEIPEPELWPGDEVARAHAFFAGGEKSFKQEKQQQVPSSREDSGSLIAKRRLTEYFNTFEDKREMRVDKKLIRRSGTINNFGNFLKKNLFSMENLEVKERIEFEDFEYDEEGKITPRVCDCYYRPETEQEKYLRKKQEEEERLKNPKKKTPLKKQEEPQEEEEIHEIQVPILGNINISGTRSRFCRWVGSILQVISDRGIKDINTNKSILCNIFPQEKGVPKFNPAGKYWVKLYYLGKERKIEIDDSFDVQLDTLRFLYPMNEQASVIWPLLLTKALAQLCSFLWNSKEKNLESGDPIIMHALTGLVPCALRTADLPNYWEHLEEVLCDENFISSKAFVLGYCSENHTPYVPSNFRTLKDARNIMVKKVMDSPKGTPMKSFRKFIFIKNLIEKGLGLMSQ